ncbi:hypothetical protein M0R36_06805 [bacterium]|jgi:spore coat polysaccharide biosynthesis protein SpsF (cytidylyltransferase family)|nr:hypothetical protein [bacterium]
MNIVGIVQSRVGSKRLPKKCFSLIHTEPLIGVIISRLLESRYITGVSVAATDREEDNELDPVALRYGCKCYHGSENDIVDRLYNAGLESRADMIVRVWGDCPLVDPRLIDRYIDAALRDDADFASNISPRSIPGGLNVEIYKMSALKRVLDETKDEFYRKYPRNYILDKNDFKVCNININSSLTGINLCVDYPGDLVFINKIFLKFKKNNYKFHIEDLEGLFKKNKKLMHDRQGLKRNIEYSDELEKRKKRGRL